MTAGADGKSGANRYLAGAGEEYFDWQVEIGRLGGRLNQWKFTGFVGPADRVADFGCGGGFLLAGLTCAQRIGVELNPAARRHAAGLGVEVHERFASVPEGSVDVVVSNHALEHVTAPFEAIGGVLQALKPGGRAVFVVPYDGWLHPGGFVTNDINQHLYAWTPQLLGNLFRAAGFQVERCEVLWSAWTPATDKWWGWNATLFRIACFVMCIRYAAPQLRIVARRPEAPVRASSPPR